MKKTLITILIIVILAGAGYFAYSKGLINFDFLKKRDVATESVVTESQQESAEKIEDKIHPLCFGTVFYGSFGGYDDFPKISIEECKKLFEKYEVTKEKDGAYSSWNPTDNAEYPHSMGGVSYKILGLSGNKIFANVNEDMGGTGQVSTILELEESNGFYNRKEITPNGGFPCYETVLSIQPIKDNFIEYTQIIDQEKVFGKMYYDTKFRCLGQSNHRYNILNDKIELLSVELEKDRGQGVSPDYEYGESMEKDCFNDEYKNYVNKKKLILNLKDIQEFNDSVRACTSKKQNIFKNATYNLPYQRSSPEDSNIPKVFTMQNGVFGKTIPSVDNPLCFIGGSQKDIINTDYNAVIKDNFGAVDVYCNYGGTYTSVYLAVFKDIDTKPVQTDFIDLQKTSKFGRFLWKVDDLALNGDGELYVSVLGEPHYLDMENLNKDEMFKRHIRNGSSRENAIEYITNKDGIPDESFFLHFDNQGKFIKK